jgi:glycerophosphoryl diester phosphodiesterase
MILYGHRGARGEAPENTVAGFLYARRLYLEGVTLDVRLSSDGVIVVAHDETVDRTTDGRGKVSSLQAAKLESLDARAEFPRWPERIGIPTLDDALDACSGIPHLAIDVQPDDPKRLTRLCDRLVETLEERRIPNRVTIRSAEPAVHTTIGQMAPRLVRSYVASFEEPADLRAAIRLGCGEIDVPLETGTALLVQVARGNGVQATGRLANTAEEIQSFVEWGVVAITSDFPSVAKRVLGLR